MEKEKIVTEDTIKEELKELMKQTTTMRKMDELEYAKKAVISCLENHAVSVDMHGLTYWAERVEKLRKEILEVL